MKRLALITALLTSAFAASAQQQMRIWHDGGDTRTNLNEINFSAEGNELSVDGKVYQTSSIDSITMVHTITVSYNGDKAFVDMGKTPGVEYTVNGADVVINNTNTRQEVEMVLQGSSTNGSLTYNGSYKCKFYLNGLDLTSATQGAIDIQCGKRVDLILCPGTDNRLADAATGMQKAALYCKGHLEVEGSGNLTVTGNARHAIATKEYLQLKKSTGNITIAKAASDAIHAGQYFLMGGGTVNINGNTIADGIQVDALTLSDDITPDPSKEDNGKVMVKGGNINITITHEDCKAIKNDADVIITGGTFDIKVQANGARGIQTDGNMSISETDATTSITIATTGGKCTQPDCANDPHRCMGIKVEKDLTVYGGTVKVTHTKSAARDIKVGGNYNKVGGTVSGVIA